MIAPLKDFSIPELGPARRGKVREVYDLDDRLLMIASDRISCFDCILDKPIPYKGQVLTDISTYWFEATKDIIPNHLLSQPHGNAMLTRKCEVIPVEMIVRGYITGSMWRDYAAGSRHKSGVPLPEGLKKNQKLNQAIITPSTKASEGHDEDISKEALLAKGIVSESQWEQLETAALRLFERGTQLLAERGITLVDTKYEFGLSPEGQLTLIDEIHTPDSSRFWFHSDGQDKELKSPDKEFVRGWLLERGFQGDGELPSLDNDVVAEASSRYRAVYQRLLGRNFIASPPLLDSLCQAGLAKGACALVVDHGDTAWMASLTGALANSPLAQRRVELSASAFPALIQELRLSLEPVVIICQKTPALSPDACPCPVITHSDAKQAVRQANTLLNLEKAPL